MRKQPVVSLVVAALLAGCGTGCSVRRFAIHKIGDAIASGGSTYVTDEDIELITQTLPFSLKLANGREPVPRFVSIQSAPE